MKKLLLLMFFCLPAAAAEITLAWDQYPDTNCTIVLYHSTTLSVPMTNWVSVTNVPATQSTLKVTVQPGENYFFITARNQYWESDPSNVAKTDPRPVVATGLKAQPRW